MVTEHRNRRPALSLKGWKLANGILAFIAVLIMAGVVFSPYIPYNIQLQEGDVANQQIQAPRHVVFESSEDKKKTHSLREERVTLVEKVFSVDEEINKNIVVNLVGTFTGLKNFRDKRQQDPVYKAPEALHFLTADQLNYMARLSDQRFGSLEYITLQNMDKLLAAGLQEVSTSNIHRAVQTNTRILQLPATQKDIVFRVILQHIEPNLFYNEAQTNAVIESEMASIKPFTTTYKEGEPIVYKGETLTKAHIEAMMALNIYGVKANFFKFVGVFVITCLLFALLERFIYYFNRRVYTQMKHYAVTYVVILLVVLLARAIQGINFLPASVDVRFLIPISVGSIVLTLLVTPNVALICGTLTALFIALMYQADLTLFIYLFLSNCVAAFAIYKKTSRTELITSGYIVGAANVLVVLGLGLFQEAYDWVWFGSNAIMAFLNGVISAMFSLAMLPYFEKLFRITTQQSLLELSNLNHPLLKKMMMTAPGTYQHSLMVANLAEAAAEAVNADPVMCRVGGYFHDIGKMKRPLFFIENQFSGENPHNTLSPRMSKMIISSHAKDGLDMAKAYKLPRVIQDFIMEHHGTSLVSFFYSQAMQTEDLPESEVSKEDFRYPGPKPQFKESGILMLADSVEAAVRSLEKPTPAKIETMVDKIFKTKLEDRQLDECPLSLKEIETIRQTLLNVLRSMYHNRIEYKDDPLIEDQPEAGSESDEQPHNPS